MDFLRARLDEDEGYARSAFAEHNDAEPQWSEIWSGALQIGPDEDLLITNDAPVSRFMARNDPARVLADVEAKRRIIDQYEASVRADVEETDLEERWVTNGVRNALGQVVLSFAQPYADHEDFQSEWWIR